MNIIQYSYEKELLITTAGIALVIGGIAVFFVSFFYLMPQEFLLIAGSGNILTTSNFLLKPRQSGNVSLNVPVIEKNLPLAAATISNQSKVPMHAIITNPDGQIDNQTNFEDHTFLLVEEPRVPGNYNLTITNYGTQSTYVDVTFGYSPLAGRGGQLNAGWVGGFAASVVMVIAGIIIGIIGIVMRKRD